MSLDSDDFSSIRELQSIREETLSPISYQYKQYESDSNYANISFGRISHLSNISEEFENFDKILSESL
jgi:hypothetical protein